MFKRIFLACSLMFVFNVVAAELIPGAGVIYIENGNENGTSRHGMLINEKAIFVEFYNGDEALLENLTKSKIILEQANVFYKCTVLNKMDATTNLAKKTTKKLFILHLKIEEKETMPHKAHILDNAIEGHEVFFRTIINNHNNTDNNNIKDVKIPKIYDNSKNFFDLDTFNKISFKEKNLQFIDDFSDKKIGAVYVEVSDPESIGVNFPPVTTNNQESAGVNFFPVNNSNQETIIGFSDVSFAENLFTESQNPIVDTEHYKKDGYDIFKAIFAKQNELMQFIGWRLEEIPNYSNWLTYLSADYIKRICEPWIKKTEPKKSTNPKNVRKTPDNESAKTNKKGPGRPKKKRKNQQQLENINEDESEEINKNTAKNDGIDPEDEEKYF